MFSDIGEYYAEKFQLKLQGAHKMFGRFFSAFNKKIVEKLKKPIEEKIDSMARKELEESLVPFPEVGEPSKSQKLFLASLRLMPAGGFIGTAIGAACTYDEKASGEEKILNGLKGGAIGGTMGYLAPPLIVLGGSTAAANAKSMLGVGTSIGGGIGSMKMFSKLTTPTHKLENGNPNKVNLRK